MDWKIGERVTFKNKHRECTGTITEIYPGYTFTDEDGPVDIPTHCAVKVDSIPEWWPYVGTDVFAPAEEDLKPCT